jgi:hypothetical protein
MPNMDDCVCAMWFKRPGTPLLYYYQLHRYLYGTDYVMRKWAFDCSLNKLAPNGKEISDVEAIRDIYMLNSIWSISIVF